MKNKYIVALGASAGGLAALSEFFENTLPDGVSYVITTHLYAHQKSRLTEMIQKHSAIDVCTVENNMQIKSNIVYVMPENKTMTIDEGNLILTDRDLSVKVNNAIDMFFVSLAEDTLFRKIAIIFSGMGKDGTKGVKALAKAGAYIIAQTPDTAGEESMPESVIAAGYINAILDPKYMPQAIIDIMTTNESL
ncbi:CheB methylesterase [Pedobacter westerhofensis]|uniref:protein-glutamate methylesterase n=1 Tax=Pedobacter westerhofensis TaxID=425512 RepID=A0A521FB86_9SPHI|nr:chemotaxis protein CheB [Pedobacter westerhofensis]SMO93425.1 CheB methylesterase [Pedobacter westerhofensis]